MSDSIDKLLDQVRGEIERSRETFPPNAHMLAALTEEVGEVARALLEDLPEPLLRVECVQVAAMALRIADEGDADFAPPSPHSQVGQLKRQLESWKAGTKIDKETIERLRQREIELIHKLGELGHREAAGLPVD